MVREKPQPTNPWFILFEVIAIAIGCILFGNYINGQFSDPTTTGFGNYLMSFGTMILLAIGLAAVIILGGIYLVYWLFYKPRYDNLYQH